MIVVARFGLSPPPLDSGLSSKSEAWFGFFQRFVFIFMWLRAVKTEIVQTGANSQVLALRQVETSQEVDIMWFVYVKRHMLAPLR